MDDPLSFSRYRIGVAGLGKMGLLHASIFHGLSLSRVVAVADPSPTMCNSLSQMTDGIRYYPDVDEMLEMTEIDALVIATPVATHIPVALAAAGKGIPFFLEKPLATSAPEAHPLVEALEKSPVPHMVGFMTRFVEAFRKGKELLVTGCLGKLQRVSASIYVSQLFSRGQGWRYDRKVSGGGVLLSQGSHLLDLLAWYFGPVRRVNADVLSVYSPGIEDFAHLMLEFDSGLRCWVDSSWSVRFHRKVEIVIEVLGDNGTMRVTDDSVKLFLDKASGGVEAGWKELDAVDLFRGVDLDVAEPQYTREDYAFLDGLRSQKMPEPGLRHALHVQNIVDAAYASSSEKGIPVRIPENGIC